MRCRIGAVLAGLCCLTFPAAASAAILDFTFHSNVAAVELFPPIPTYVNEPLTITFRVDTATISLGTGIGGSNEYKNLTAFVSSAPLGLKDVADLDPLTVDIGAPGFGPPLAGATILLKDCCAFNGLTGNPAISTWNEVGPIGPLDFSAITTGYLLLPLANGESLVVLNLEDAPPFGQATFRASPVVPEPGTWALLALGFAGLGVFGRPRRTA